MRCDIHGDAFYIDLDVCQCFAELWTCIVYIFCEFARFYFILFTFRSIRKTKQESALNQNYVVSMSENMEHTDLNWAIFCMWWNILNYSFNASNGKSEKTVVFLFTSFKMIDLNLNNYRSYLWNFFPWNFARELQSRMHFIIWLYGVSSFILLLLLLRVAFICCFIAFFSSLVLLFLCFRYKSLQILLISSSSTRSIISFNFLGLYWNYETILKNGRPIRFAKRVYVMDIVVFLCC